MIHSINHETIFDYETMPQSVVQRLHLTPLNNTQQHLIDWDIEVNGGSIVLKTADYHGNKIHLCNQHSSLQKFQIICRGQINVIDANGIVGKHDNNIPLEIFKNTTNLTLAGPRLRQLGREMNKLTKIESEISVLHALSARLADAIKYRKGMTDTSTTAERAMEIGAGVCQDHAHAFIAVARYLGLSARYVSGYLLMRDKKIQNASHAWAEVFTEGLGWVGFDISNGISPDDRYVKLASGFDYADVAPLSGVRFGNGEEQIATRIMISQQ